MPKYLCVSVTCVLFVLEGHWLGFQNWCNYHYVSMCSNALKEFPISRWGLALVQASVSIYSWLLRHFVLYYTVLYCTFLYSLALIDRVTDTCGVSPQTRHPCTQTSYCKYWRIVFCCGVASDRMSVCVRVLVPGLWFVMSSVFRFTLRKVCILFWYTKHSSLKRDPAISDYIVIAIHLFKHASRLSTGYMMVID